MPVFSLSTLILGIIIFAITTGINHFYPFLQTPFENLGIGIITASIGYIAEFLGYESRLFWIPIWILGLIIAGSQTYKLWNLTGLLPILAALILGLAILRLKHTSDEKSDWALAPEALRQAQLLKAERDAAMWDALQDAFFVPGILEFTPQMIAHNREVLDFLITLMEEDECPDEWIDRIDTLDQYFEQAQAGSNHTPEDLEELIEFVQRIFENEGDIILYVED